MLGQWAHQPIERHDFRQHARARRQTCTGEHVIHAERLPHLVADVHRSRLPRLLNGHPGGMDRDQIGCPCGRARRLSRRLDPRHDAFEPCIAFQLRLTAERRVDPARERAPVFGRRGRQAAQRADDAVARSLGGCHRLDEEVIEIGPAVDALGGALD